MAAYIMWIDDAAESENDMLRWCAMKTAAQLRECGVVQK